MYIFGSNEEKPLDQSAAYILGLLQRKNSIFAFFSIFAILGEKKKIGGEQKKIAPNFGALFGGGGDFYYKTGLKMGFLAKMLAADRSSAEKFYIGSNWLGRKTKLPYAFCSKNVT